MMQYSIPIKRHTVIKPHFVRDAHRVNGNIVDAIVALFFLIKNVFECFWSIRQSSHRSDEPAVSKYSLLVGVAAKLISKQRALGEPVF